MEKERLVPPVSEMVPGGCKLGSEKTAVPSIRCLSRFNGGRETRKDIVNLNYVLLTAFRTYFRTSF